VAYIVINITINYILCVTTRNSQNKHYDNVVRELARATGFDHPETEEQRENWRHKWREIITEKARQKRLRERREMMSKYGHDYDDEEEESRPSNDNGSQHASTSTSNEHVGISTIESKSDVLKRRKNGIGAAVSTPQVSQPAVPMGRSWMWIGPNDWSYCNRTGLPKPPRSHFDHVTNRLVLNMDHYCPWMFNTIGYFNYRYFVNFLIYVAVGMVYGALIMYQPFMMIDSPDYRRQISLSRDLYQRELNLQRDHEINSIDMGKKSFFRYSHVQHLIPNVPIPREATSIAFSFMMSVAVGLSVFLLLVFHLYLISTAQTTIEFHGNRLKREQCKMRGEVFSNPYDLGLHRNLEQVWGRWGNSGNPWLLFWTALLPSWRENEFLPIPFLGESGLRDTWKQSKSLCQLQDNEEESILANMV